MSTARILALVDGTSDSETVARASVDLGQRFGAEVEWLAILSNPARVLPATADAMGTAMISAILESDTEMMERQRVEVERLAKVYGEDRGAKVIRDEAKAPPRQAVLKLRDVEGPASQLAGERGRLFDLLIVSMGDDEKQGLEHSPLEAAMFGSGRPVLGLPSATKSTPGQIVGLAWDGSREAARAMTAALPFLQQAEKVFVLTAFGPDTEALPSQTLDYLAAHGIEAQTWGFIPGEGRLGDELLAQAEKAGLDLLVMGAYGHQRLAEVVLGGVTRRVLEQAQIPVLLAH